MHVRVRKTVNSIRQRSTASEQPILQMSDTKKEQLDCSICWMRSVWNFRPRMPTPPVTSTAQALRSVSTSRWLVGGRSGLRILSGSGNHEIRPASNMSARTWVGQLTTGELFHEIKGEV